MNIINSDQMGRNQRGVEDESQCVFANHTRPSWGKNPPLLEA